MSEGRGAMPDLGQVLLVAKKEFMDNVRGKWVLGLSILFVVLALVVSSLGAVQSGAGVGIRGFTATAIGMIALAGTLVPILGLMLSYATVAGEREQGSLQLLLTMPLTRLEILLGKLLGLSSVTAVSIVGGLGLAGLIIFAAAGGAGWEGYLVTVGGTMLLATAFVAIGLLFSSLTAKRSTAIAFAVFIWFGFTVIWGLLILGLAAASGVSFNFTTPGPVLLPDWVWAVDISNPGEAFQALAFGAFGVSEVAGFGFVQPAWASGALMVLILLAWVLVSFTLAHLRLRNADL